MLANSIAVLTKMIFIYIFFDVRFDPLLWPRPTPRDHNLNKLESTLPVDQCFQTSLRFSLSGQIVFGKKILKDIFLPIVAPPYPGDYDLSFKLRQGKKSGNLDNAIFLRK